MSTVSKSFQCPNDVVYTLSLNLEKSPQSKGCMQIRRNQNHKTMMLDTHLLLTQRKVAGLSKMTDRLSAEEKTALNAALQGLLDENAAEITAKSVPIDIDTAMQTGEFARFQDMDIFDGFNEFAAILSTQSSSSQVHTSVQSRTGGFSFPK